MKQFVFTSSNLDSHLRSISGGDSLTAKGVFTLSDSDIALNSNFFIHSHKVKFNLPETYVLITVTISRFFSPYVRECAHCLILIPILFPDSDMDPM